MRQPHITAFLIFYLLLPKLASGQTWEWVCGLEQWYAEAFNEYMFDDDGFYTLTEYNKSVFTTTSPDIHKGFMVMKFDHDANWLCNFSLPDTIPPWLVNLSNTYVINRGTNAPIRLKADAHWLSRDLLSMRKLNLNIGAGCQLWSIDEKKTELPYHYKRDTDGSIYFTAYGPAVIYDTLHLSRGESARVKLNENRTCAWFKKSNTLTSIVWNATFPDSNYIYYAGENKSIFGICRSDTLGKIILSRQFDGTGKILDIKVCPSGDFLICGTYQGLVTSGKDTLGRHDKSGAFLMSTDEHFNIRKVWYTETENPEYISFTHLETSVRGDIYLFGRARWQGHDYKMKFQAAEFNITPEKEFFYLKLDTLNRITWGGQIINHNYTDEINTTFVTQDKCGNIYYHLFYDGGGENTGTLDLEIGNFTLYKKPWSGSLLFKLNPDSLMYETESSCSYIRFTNKSDKEAYTKFEWILPGDSAVASDELIFTQNPYHEKVSIGLKGYKAGGCTNTYYRTVDLTSFLPKAEFTVSDTTGCTPHTISVSPTDPQSGIQYIYHSGDGRIIDSSSTTITYTKAGLYTIKQIASNSEGCTDTAYKTIRLLDDRDSGCSSQAPLLHIPNAFSPDNNGLNETFSVSHTGIRALHIEIYNRWGERVFSSDSPDFQWNGTFRGASAVEGVYYYRMEAYSYTDEKMYFKGTVQVVR